MCFTLMITKTRFSFFQCFGTSDDGYIEEACKHGLHSYIYYQPEQHRGVWPLWPNLSAFKWKHTFFRRDIGLFAGNTSPANFHFAFFNLEFCIRVCESIIYGVTRFGIKWLSNNTIEVVKNNANGYSSLLLLFLFYLWASNTVAIVWDS